MFNGSDVRWYHYLVILNGNISDVAGKRGRILDVVVFLFNMGSHYEAMGSHYEAMGSHYMKQ